jgi:hypothetical protein
LQHLQHLEEHPAQRDACSYCRMECRNRSPKKNRIGAAQRPARAAADAARPGSGWDPASGRLKFALSRSWKGPRPIRPSPETPDGSRNRDPRKGHYENIPQRNPLRQPTRDKSSERRYKLECAHPAGTALLQPTLLRLRRSNPMASR